jgi:hypothetical protein
LKTVDEVRTEAFSNLESNLAGIRFIIEEIGVKNLARRSKGLQALVRRQIKDGAIVDSKRLAVALTKIASGSSEDIRSFHFWIEWTGIMLFTFFVAYLEDGLVILAKKNPNVMRDLPSLEAKQLFETPSIEEWRDEVRKRWAESFLQGRGPDDWCKRLIALGARGFVTNDIATLKHLFETRNSIIHTHGVASREYIKNYPNQRLEEGRIRVGLAQLSVWINAVDGFVKTTDAFLLSYQSVT